ncbi:uncharacterized protein LOC124950646 [Vespa velutina]|uniref:uncharacterized protein LOC124950646 n=1 Tax=Vespa velutina TaxID=202808 RepID=UPI001FB32E3E|nr:uncharacterized protein LOC124950646 [Vespa velutina]
MNNIGTRNRPYGSLILTTQQPSGSWRQARYHFYPTPNELIYKFREKIDMLEEVVRNTRGNVLVADDFNARAVEWRMPHQISRGKYVVEMAARTGLYVLNVSSTTTFRRLRYTEAIPDIPLINEDLLPRIEKWKVIENYTESEHQYIIFSVYGESRRSREDKATPRRWNVQKLDTRNFIKTISWEIEVTKGPEATWKAATETLVGTIIRHIVTVCAPTILRKRPRHSKRPAYWWTPEIAELRLKCLKLRRTAQASKWSEANAKSAEHYAAKKQLCRAINKSKVGCWKKLREEISSDP